MLCLKVSVNAEPMCVAGVGEYGVLNAIVGWVRADPDRVCRPGQHYIRTPRESLDLTVGGLAQGEFQDWVKRHLAVGDHVLVEIVDAQEADPPAQRKPESVARDAYDRSQQDLKDHLSSELAAVERTMSEHGTPQRCSFCCHSASPDRPLVAAANNRGNICGDCARIVLEAIAKRTT